MPRGIKNTAKTPANVKTTTRNGQTLATNIGGNIPHATAAAPATGGNTLVAVMLDIAKLPDFNRIPGYVGHVVLDEQYVGKNGGIGFRPTGGAPIMNVRNLPCYVNAVANVVDSASAKGKAKFNALRESIKARSANVATPDEDVTDEESVDLSGWMA